MKRCIACDALRPMSDYYSHPRMADGRLNKCKECCRKYARARHYQKMRDPAWLEAERQRGRQKAAASDYRLPTEVRSSNSAALRAVPHIPNGFERHHWSYQHQHWKDVIVLSIRHHRAVHQHMRYDADAKLFRTPRGHLLDTRAKHERWIAAVLRERAQFIEEAA